MRWLAAGSSTILICAVALGCADEPGEPVSGQVGTIQSTGSAAPGEPEAESGVAEPVPPAPPVPTGRVTTKRTALPGVPGSPIRYDSTLLGASPEVAKSSIEAELAAQCGPDLCGVRVVLRPRGTEGCISEISPMPVDPGGTVTVHHGPQCAEQRGETLPEDTRPEDTQQENTQPEDVPGDTEPGGPVTPTETTDGG